MAEPYEHEAIRLGSMLVTLVEPHQGHEVAYNRWYERDHFYSGCMIGPWTLAGGRYVATRDCKDRRPGGENEITGPAARGSYLALYWIQADRYREWIDWAGAQVMWLHENGRMFAEREHVHTQMYRFAWSWSRDADSVPPELALDRRFPGLIPVFGEVAEGVDPDQVHSWYRDQFLPQALATSPVSLVVAASPRPLQQGPDDVPRAEGSERRFLHLCFVDGDPLTAWDEHVAGRLGDLEEAGLGRILFAGPFLATVFGTDTYTDQLW